MSSIALLVGGFMPYLTVSVFLAGMAYRFYVWFRTPQPSKMTLFGRKQSSTARAVLMEALLLPGLFRGDRSLWAFSWVFHATLALVLLGHVRVFTHSADGILMAMGMTDEGIDRLSAFAGGVAGVVLLATGLLLLGRRFTLPRVREISRGPDFLALGLILAIVATGDIMRFAAVPFDLQQTRAWAASLLTLSPAVPADNWFLLHALLAQLLIVLLPFSKILHFGGIFFTQALVKAK